MNYYKKYLKYKQKYLNLKYGGYNNVNDPDDLSDDNTTIGGIIYNQHSKHITSNFDERKYIYNAINRFDENKNAVIITTKKNPTGNAITIVADKYVIRIVKNPNKEYIKIYEHLVTNPHKNLECVNNIVNLNTIYIIFTKKLIPIIDYKTKEFIKNFNKEKWLKDIQTARDEIHKLGLLHNDISDDNSLYDSENDVYVLTDYDNATLSKNPTKELDNIYFLNEKIEE